MRGHRSALARKYATRSKFPLSPEEIPREAKPQCLRMAGAGLSGLLHMPDFTLSGSFGKRGVQKTV